MSVFFTNVGLLELAVRFSSTLFFVIHSFLCFWLGILCKTVLVMLGFSKALLLVLLFSCHALLIFLILFVTRLFMLTVLLSAQNVIRHLLKLPSELTFDF